MNEYQIEEHQETGMPYRTTQTEMMVSRQAQEVQAAIVVAKRFPRNSVDSYNRVIDACKRKKLAEAAIYEYPRGGQKITGPSIRLAEAIAQNWGNIDFGITELEQRNGESQVMAYAWDLETNTRQTKIFTVKHIRHTKNGDYPLTDPRDIYEMVANNGARRLRACILGVIPGDVVEGAVEQCNKTMIGDAKKPVIDMVREMAQIFKTEFGVTLQQIEKYIGWRSESFSMNDLVKMRRLYNSLKDGMTKKEDVFDMSIKEEVVDALGQKEEQPKQQAKTSRKGAAKKQEKTELPEQENPFQQSFMMPEGNDEELPFR